MEEILDPMWEKNGIGYTWLEAEKGEITDKAQKGEETFAMGDASSIFVYISVMQLIEKGEVAMDDAAANYLPEGIFAKLTDETPITVADLLNCTVGWESHWRESETADLTEYIRETEPAQVYEVGEVRTHRRYPTLVLSALMEGATGKSYDAYVKEEILQPLGMEETHFEKTPGWTYNGAMTTVADLGKLLCALTTGEGIFADPATLDAFYTRSYTVHEKMPGIAYGLQEFAAETFCLGVNAGEEEAFGGIRIFPESRKAAALVCGNVKGTEFARLPERLLESVCGERVIPERADKLPRTAPMAGEYIQADRPQKGYLELARDMVGLQIIKAKPYTDTSITTLYVYSTYYSSQYLNTFRGFTNLYFNTVDQIDGHLFVDIYGNLLYFVTDEEGKVEKFVFENEEYVPTPKTRTIGVVNATIWLIYLCAGFAVINLVIQTIMLIRDKMTYWPIYTTNWLAYAHSLVTLALIANSCMLLYYSYANLPFGICQLHLILNWVFTGLGIALTALMLVYWNRSELRPHEKGLYIATMAVMAVFILVCLWWNLYL